MKLFSPETDISRPITDRVKGSLFNVLCNTAIFGRVCTGRRPVLLVADLFCGVGSLGLEALSRGAEFVTFVEKDPKVSVVLKKNIEKAGFAGVSRVIRADAFRIGAPPNRDPSLGPRDPFSAWGHLTVERRATSDGQRTYDLIFVDPPYSASRETGEGSPLSKLLVLLNEQSTTGGLVVVRTERRTGLLERYGCFQTIERRQWGTMAVTILQRSSKCQINKRL